MNSGPVLVGWIDKKRLIALMGHKEVLFPASRINVPCRNGSVLDVLIMTVASLSSVVFTSLYRRVECGSYLFLYGDVYSDIRKKPKKAVRIAVHIMTLSSYIRDELNNSWLM